MSELTRLAQPLIDQPLVERPDVGALRSRNRRRRRRRLSGLCVLVVVALVGAFAPTLQANKSGNTLATGTSRLASYFEASVNVPDATLAAVGLPSSVAVPTKVTPTIATAPSNQVISYVGAEFCPFCAIQRWSLLVALSKFGTFSHLSDKVLSSSSDVYPNLASWSFVGARYTSPYFTFDPTELFSSVPDGSGGYQPLEKMSAAQKTAFDQFDPQGGLPFVDLGNHFVTIGASSSPSVLQGLSLEQIGSSLADPASPVARGVDGTANYLIAGMCSMVSGTKPAICSTATTALALRALGSGSSPAGSTSSSKPPVQPPTNAPMSEWRLWSEEMHAYTLRAAAAFEPTTPGCSVDKVSVVSSTYTKTTFGIPPGVKVWAISATGRCGHKRLSG
ncbi:MAG: DUF929 family protein [Acidimicrobiales bacterium]|jgi:hypothetical protein|nr:DUF929 family protein [Actinomycetota bacterium]MDA8356244.1 DUF929 family protein [Actinomycetota bacterium]